MINGMFTGGRWVKLKHGPLHSHIPPCTPLAWPSVVDLVDTLGGNGNIPYAIIFVIIFTPG